MPNRHLSRTICLQSLYEWDFKPNLNIEEVAKRNMERFNKEDVDKKYIKKVTKGVTSKIKEIDDKIQKAAAEWPLEQISVLDKSLLRLSSYELLYMEEIPPKVAINEAVELGKTFGGENTSKFVNGVLGTLYRECDRYIPEEDLKAIEKALGKSREPSSAKATEGKERDEKKNKA